MPHRLGNPRHRPTGYHGTRGFPFRARARLFLFFFLFSSSRPHARGILFYREATPDASSFMKKARFPVIGEQYFFYSGPETSRSNKTSGYIVGNVPELLLTRNC